MDKSTARKDNSLRSKAANPSLHQLVLQQNSAKAAAEICRVCAPHQRALLDILGLAYRHDMNLGGLLDQFCAEAPNRNRNSISQLADDVRSGEPAIQSIGSKPDLLPPSVLATLQYSQENNSLDLLYENMLGRTAGSTGAPNDEWQQMLWSLLRQCFVCLITVVIFCFISIQVIPEMIDLQEEFGLEHPAAFELFGYATDWFLRYFLIVLLVGMGIVVLVSPILYRFLVDAIRGWNPLLWKSQTLTPGAEKRKILARNHHSGYANPESSAAVANLNKAINAPNAKLLPIAIDKVITRAESNAIAATQSAETRAWLLEFLANRYEQVSNSRAILMMKFVLGIANIVIGLFVLLAATAIFSILIGLIQELNNQ